MIRNDLSHGCLCVLILLLGGTLCSRQASAQSGGGNEEKIPIRSVLRRSKDIFSSTSGGIFRASLSENKWRRLATPESMPLNGSFATEPENAEKIFYYAARRSVVNSAVDKQNEPLQFGLYDPKTTVGHGNWFLIKTTMVQCSSIPMEVSSPSPTAGTFGSGRTSSSRKMTEGAGWRYPVTHSGN